MFELTLCLHPPLVAAWPGCMHKRAATADSWPPALPLHAQLPPPPLSAFLTQTWPPVSPLRPDVQESGQLNRGAGRQLLADGTFDVRPWREAAAAAA